MRTVDALGRQYPNQLVSTDMKVRRPTGARLRVLEAHCWFGVFSMQHAVELMVKAGNKNRNKNRIALKELAREENTDYDSPYLFRPKIQFPNLDVAYFNRRMRLVQDISPAGIEYLKDINRYAEYPRSGSYYHQLGEGTIMVEFLLGVESKRDHTFIPRHRCTSHPNQYPVTFDWTKPGGKKKEPHKAETFETTLRIDGTFIGDYGGKQRLFFVELNRGSLNGNHETIDGVFKYKKTILRSLLQMREFIGEGHYKKNFPQKGADGSAIGALSLQIFTNLEAMEHAMRLLDRETDGRGNNYILFRYDPRFAEKTFPAPIVSLDNWNGEWLRVGRPPMHINVL